MVVRQDPEGKEPRGKDSPVPAIASLSEGEPEVRVGECAKGVCTVFDKSARFLVATAAA